MLKADRDDCAVYLSYVEEIPSEVMQPMVDAFVGAGRTVKVEQREAAGPWASLVWFIPTAAILFLTKAYVDSFLKEAGKDHYHVLKKAVGSMWSTFFGDQRKFGVTLVASSPNKLESTSTYSLSLSIMAEASELKAFKLLLRDDSTQPDLESASAAFLAFVAGFHAGTLEQRQRAQVDTASAGGLVVVAYDRATGSIDILNLASRGRDADES